MDLTGITPEYGWQDRNTLLSKATSGTPLEEADVVLAFSNHEEDTICIPSGVLIASSDFFKTSLSSRWNSRGNCESAIENAGQSPASHSYGLTLDRQSGVYTLIRGSPPDTDSISEDERRLPVACTDSATCIGSCPYHQLSWHIDFYRSSCGISVPDRVHRSAGKQLSLSLARKYAIRDHKSLFALVVGFDFDMDDLNIEESVVSLANVCAYATFYQMLPAVAKSIGQKLENVKGVWANIRLYPDFYLALGCALRSEEIFTDAVRHAVGKYGSFLNAQYDWAEDKTDSPDILLLLYKKRSVLERSIRDLEDSLRQLCFHSPYWAYFDTRNPPTDTETDKAVYLARAVFSEWLNVKLASNLTGRRGRPVYNEILQSAKTGSLRLFRDKTPSRLVEMFKLKKTSKAATDSKKMIKKELRDLVQKAAELIQDFIDSEWAPHAKCDVPMTRFDSPYITNLCLSKEDLPWADEELWGLSDSVASEVNK